MAYTEEVPSSVEDVLEKGLRLAGASPVHLVFRGTAQEDSVRCDLRGVARTPEQREAAIRFWLDLDDDEALPSASEAERRFVEELNRSSVAYPEAAKANFKTLARGGITTDYQFATLAGTASLNWNGDTALTSWQGIRVTGNPGRVQMLLLADLSLDGTDLPPIFVPPAMLVQQGQGVEQRAAQSPGPAAYSPASCEA